MVKLPQGLGALLAAMSVVYVATESCSHMAPTATDDQATIVLQATPAQIAAKTGVSTITALGVKKTGAPIWDGTEVYFHTDSGRIDPTTATFQDGRATTHLYAPATAGTATISATSGTVSISDIQVEIGATAASLLLTSSRTTLPVGGGSVTLRATVQDDNGNPLSAIPVLFTTTAGVLSSHGRAVDTNASGVSQDVLTTEEDATVTARASGASDDLDITVKTSPGNEPPVPEFSYSPQDPVVGTTVYFNGGLSSDPDGRIVKYDWDFGDGMRAHGERASHIYAQAGTYAVVLCVTDNQGARACSDGTQITVSDGGENQPPTASFTFSPSSPTEGATVYFNGELSTDSDGRISRYDWDFGDGATAGGKTPTHVYDAAGTYAVVLCVTDDKGAQGCTQGQVTVNEAGGEAK